MRDRDQRLQWIEQLIGGQQDVRRASALVIPTMSGNMAIEFSAIEEVVDAGKVQPMAFLPPEFCGVLHRGNELAPIIDVGGDQGKAAHVALVRGGGCLLGLKFSGVPSVIDLNEVDHAVLEIRLHQKFHPDTMPVLDMEAVAKALLDMD